MSPAPSANEKPPAEQSAGGFFASGRTAGVWAGSGVSGRSKNIGLRLSLASTRLAPDRTLEGVLTLGNLGEKESVQCELRLEGLPTECYQIEPTPLLYAGGENTVMMYLYHKGNRIHRFATVIGFWLLRTTMAVNAMF